MHGVGVMSIVVGVVGVVGVGVFVCFFRFHFSTVPISGVFLFSFLF